MNSRPGKSHQNGGKRKRTGAITGNYMDERVQKENKELMIIGSTWF